MSRPACTTSSPRGCATRPTCTPTSSSLPTRTRRSPAPRPTRSTCRSRPPEPQSRLKTFFRIILAIPALIIAGVLRYLGLAVAIIGWFAALFLGRMPKGLRDVGCWTLRVDQQTYAYLSLLTDKYPQFGPTPEPDAVAGSV